MIQLKFFPWNGGSPTGGEGGDSRQSSGGEWRSILLTQLGGKNGRFLSNKLLTLNFGYHPIQPSSTESVPPTSAI